MTATLPSTMPLTAWLPLQSAAGAFRDECSSLEQMVQELFADLDRLSGELEAKADELDEGRRRLAERGKQLADQRKETAQLSHQLEQQETQLSETLVELRELRAELANRPEPVQPPDLGPEVESLRKQVTDLQVERAVLLERLTAEVKQAERDGSAPDLTELKQSLLEQQERHLVKALDELRGLQSEFSSRTESPSGQNSENANLLQQVSELQVEQGILLRRLEEATLQVRSDEPSSPRFAVLSADSLQSLSQQFAEQLAGLQEQFQASHPGPSAVSDLAEFKQALLEQHESQLQTALGELREMRAEFAARAESPSADDSETIALRQQVSELAVERAVLLERLAAGGQPALPGNALALSKETLESLTDQFARQFVALQEQVQSLQHDPPEVAQLEALKQERLELEAELDLVRSRSAALSETVSLQKRELTEQRRSIAEELKEMRALIAEQTRMLSDQGPAKSAVPATSEQPRVEKDAPAHPIQDETSSKHLDPVVNSVMAQFAKLQKDIAQRRKKK